MLAKSPSDPLHRRLRRLCCLHRRSNCYRVERSSSRAGLSFPLWTSAFSRRTEKSLLHSESRPAGVLSDIACFRQSSGTECLHRSKVLLVNATAITGIVLALLTVELSSGQSTPYRVLNGRTDSDGFPTTPAKICISSASGDQCYSPPSPESPLPPFGLNPTAENLKLSTGVMLTVFTAESSSGGSGSLTSIALLENRDGQWLDLLPTVTVTNQSEYHFWNLPTVSAMPILLTADFVWGEGETHFARHHYRITSYVYHRQAGRYVQRDEYVTEKKYDGLDDATEIKVLAAEKAVIVRRLRSR